MMTSYLKYLILILILVVLLISEIVAGADIRSQLIEDVVFETGPGQAPYLMPLSLHGSFFIDFELNRNTHYSDDRSSGLANSRQSGPSVGYFWALNDGNLVFINRRENLIYILDPVEGEYYKLAPISGLFTGLHYLWVGPEDEIYVMLNYLKEPAYSEYPNPFSSRGCSIKFKLFRYKKIENGYILDTEANFPALPHSPTLIRVSPNNNLFFQYYRENAIFNKYGRLIKNTLAQGQTQDWNEFVIKSNNLGLIEVTDINSGEIIMRDEFTRQIGNNNFKSTFDNHLILYFHSNHEFKTPNNGTVKVDIPFVMGKDLNTGTRYSIDLMDCARSDYAYFNVADVSINYLGEIYAIVVYFDKTGIITGDEKIVLYRWRRAS